MKGVFNFIVAAIDLVVFLICWFSTFSVDITKNDPMTPNDALRVVIFILVFVTLNFIAAAMRVYDDKQEEQR